jgi:hypothetical protein
MRLPACGSGASHVGRDCHTVGTQRAERSRALAKPDTFLAWYRRLIAQKFDGSPAWLSRARGVCSEIEA